VDALVDALPCGYVSFGDDGHVLATNAVLRARLGYAPDEIEGRHVETLLTIAGRIFFQTHLFPLLRLHGEAQEIFLLLRAKDGGEVGALVNAVRRERGGAAVTDCVLLEVRERRKYEDELLRARRAAESANAALEARTREVEEVNERLQQQALELELQHQQMEEQAAELETQSEALRDLNDALQAHAEEVERARAVADEANRAKSAFLATMSHELRTPLNAIGGYVQLLELGIHGPLAEGQRDALSRVARAQQHLLRLINELLNLARIEAGHIEYTIEDLSLADVVGSVTPLLEPQVAAKSLALAVSTPPGIRARGDRDKVQQILINLLTNAVKFTPSGGRVAIAAREDAARVLVDVTDTGVGVGAHERERIFEPFVRAESGERRQVEGTGLGLAISRTLARGMGGDLTVESALGTGSTFTLVLPRA